MIAFSKTTLSFSVIPAKAGIPFGYVKETHDQRLGLWRERKKGNGIPAFAGMTGDWVGIGDEINVRGKGNAVG